MPVLMNMYGSNGGNNGPEPEYDNNVIVNCDGDANGNTTGIPKTPEILNLLASISPLEDCLRRNGTVEKISPVDSFSADTCSSSSTVDSPTSPQNHRSSDIKLQFIKTNLKLTIQKKRKNQNLSSNESDMNPSSHDSCAKCDESSMDTEEDDGNSSHSEANSSKFGLTPEDEERRKRRRERNKIAATKCRQKKRVRQDLLLKESSVLENQNQELKLKIEDLREEYQRLKSMYAGHKGNCVEPSPETSPVEDLLQPPSFAANNNGDIISNPVFLATNYENVNSIPSSDIMHHHQNNMYDYSADPFVRNPSVMLSESDDMCKSTYLRQNGSSDDSSYKLMPPMSSFNLIMEDSGNHHFDMTYVQ